MKKFYVSLVRDLLGYYLVFEAESEVAVRNYIRDEYKGSLPWCAVYNEDRFHAMRQEDKYPMIIIKSKCGPLYEE